MDIYRYVHPQIQAAIAFLFTAFLALFTGWSVRRMHRLQTLGLGAFTLGMLASALFALAKHYDWPFKDRLSIIGFIPYGIGILFLCCYGYRYGTEEQKISMTQDLILIAIPIAILLGAYLFALWRRS